MVTDNNLTTRQRAYFHDFTNLWESAVHLRQIGKTTMSKNRDACFLCNSGRGVSALEDDFFGVEPADLYLTHRLDWFSWLEVVQASHKLFGCFHAMRTFIYTTYYFLEAVV